MDEVELMEKWVRILDRMAAWICFAVGGLIALAGIVFVVMTYLDHGTMTGHEFTLALAATWLATGAALIFAAKSMQRHSRWRWLLHAVPVILFLAGITFAIFLADSFSGL